MKVVLLQMMELSKHQNPEKVCRSVRICCRIISGNFSSKILQIQISIIIDKMCIKNIFIGQETSKHWYRIWYTFENNKWSSIFRSNFYTKM